MSIATILMALRESEDEKRSSQVLAAAGHRVSRLAAERIESLPEGTADLIILDTELTSCTTNGFNLCQQIRSNGTQVPVLFLTADGQLESKLRAFNAGADDYVTQPVAGSELVARVAALLRRARSKPASEHFVCHVGKSVVDLNRGCATHDQISLTLTAKELDLLRYLFERRGRIVSRQQVLREVWRYESSGTRTIDVHLSTLRHKLEENPGKPRHLITVRRQGYTFRE